jgi:ribosomal protein S18 acetylase RimI-like enzyme
MWRPATEHDDDVVVELCIRLYEEDPGPLAGDGRFLRETLARLRREPWRGRPVVLDVSHQVAGYALLIAYWSNELGGEVCAVDELYVAHDFRSRGHGAALIQAIERGTVWPAPVAAIALGVTPGNTRALRLYERLGFAAIGVSMAKRILPPPPR